MRKIILYTFVFLAGCQRDNVISPAAPFIGEYKMIKYIIDQDTLVNAVEKVDKWDYKDLTVQISQGSTDSTASISYTCYHKQSLTKSEIQYSESIIQHQRDRYHILNYWNTIDNNGGYIKGDTLYSRAIAINEKTLNPLETIIIAVKVKQQ